MWRWTKRKKSSTLLKNKAYLWKKNSLGKQNNLLQRIGGKFRVSHVQFQMIEEDILSLKQIWAVMNRAQGSLWKEWKYIWASWGIINKTSRVW